MVIKRIKIVQFAILLIALFISFYGHSQQEETKLFKDTLDGAFDVSNYLFELHGFLPIITVITEPALGYGGVGAGIYFIPKEKTADKKFRMPDIAGVGGGYTQNGTWFAGGGYAGFWKDDKIRYRGVLGYGDINLKYYGKGGDYLANNPIDFSIKSLFFLQQALFRIRDSRFMLGGKYYFGKTRVSAFEESNIPGVNPRDFDLVSSGVGVIGEYENFNNILSPSKGLRIQLDYSQSLEFLGSDRNFGKLTFFTLGYIPLTNKWNSGFRFESILASENTPFYSMPYINLRGVPVLRYQGQLTALAETEQFVTVYKRWSVVGFAGLGSTVSSVDEMNFTPSVWNAGGGFRYLIARMLGLQMGMDIARGPEDWAFYIVFGSSWLK
jgi:hypothetical protein